MILQWLTSPAWANVVEALLHTLWQGAVIALLLGFALRRLNNPVARYRFSLAALGGLLLAGLVTWSVLNRPLPQKNSNSPVLQSQPANVVMANGNLPPLVVNSPLLEPKPVAMPWSAWLAMFWLTGATVMIFRAGFQVAGAERLRRSSHPLADATIEELLVEARRAVGLTRRVRMAVTDKLTSPAVVGVLVPTLILPLSLTTTLTPEQIRFVLLHELAHIRRGDYLASLFQLFAEALLFFNPAVWWISRQIRIEREACCDTLAVELSGAPADYARTLVYVAENVLHPVPVAASAFGDKREPSSLADRVQRMLVPGYRPKLRLTWRAMLVALFVSGGLLFLSALGTRVTVAAILSPQERIDRIEKKMTELGEKPEADFNGNDANAPQVRISGQVRMADGSRVPEWVWLNVNSSVKRASYGTSVMARNGFFTNSIRAGTIYIGAEISNCSPVFIGPLDGFATNRFENLEIVLPRGFDAPLQLVDADNGQPVVDANVSTIFWLNNNGFQYHFWKSGADGSVTLTHCADLPLDVTVNVPGYEITKKRFDHVRAGEPLRVELRRGAIISGAVLDKTTGQPIAGAEWHLLYQTDIGNFEWNNSFGSLGKTDASGAFTLNQLRKGLRYYLGVSAAGHESVILDDIPGGSGDLVARLGSELIVSGHVIGNLNGLQTIDNAYCLSRNFSEIFGNNNVTVYSQGYEEWVPLHVTNGVATFQFTNRSGGPVTLSGKDGYREERTITVPIKDWVVDLNQAVSTNAPLPSREVILRFQSPSGVAPKGTVYVTVPSRMDIAQPGYQRKEVEIQNGEVHAQTFAGAFFNYEPARTVGFWFKQNFIQPIEGGTNVLVIDVPVVPAGVIFAHAKNADGSAAGGLLFSAEELKRSPQRDENSPLSDGSDNFADNAPRRWISGPLPLGGTYQIIAWLGNSFCTSESVKLTESQPDAEVELQFPPAKSFTGQVLDADGQPIRSGEVGVEFVAGNNHSFGLKSALTDEQGRFRVDDATPGVGKYNVIVSDPGCRAEKFEVNFSHLPLAMRLQHGHVLAGQVVEAGTGYVIPDAEVRAWTDDGKLPSQTARTDGDGRFEFNTLGDKSYHVYVDGANFAANAKNEFETGQTNLLLKVTLYQGSQLASKAPANRTNFQKAGMAGNLSSRTNAVDAKVAASKLVQDGKLDYEMGKLDDAEKSLKSALAIDPENAAAKYYLGLVQSAGQTFGNNPAKSGRFTIMKNLSRIRITKLDFEQANLAEIVRQLNALAMENDLAKVGVHFSVDTNSVAGLLINTNPVIAGLHLQDVRLADVLDAIVMVPIQQIQYSIQDDGVVFSFKDKPDNQLLFMRTFKVDPNAFYAGLQNAVGEQKPNVAVAARKFFTTLGVDLESPKGKSVFYNDRMGLLFVKATEVDLDTIERVIQTLNQVAPQVHIKAQFLKVPKGTMAGFGNLFGSTNAASENFTGILNATNVKTVLRLLEERKGVESLAEPEAVTASGRQVEMHATQIITVVTNFAFKESSVSNGPSSIYPQTAQAETGPILNVIPHVLADGYTINLTVIPSLTEFYGYATPPDVPNVTGTNNRVQLPVVLPQFNTRRLSANLNLWDGQTIVVGGMAETNYVTDKVPVLGSVPLLGRLFQSKNATENEILVLVTVTIVDPVGNRVHAEEKLPFAQTGIPPQPLQSN